MRRIAASTMVASRRSRNLIDPRFEMDAPQGVEASQAHERRVCANGLGRWTRSGSSSVSTRRRSSTSMRTECSPSSIPRVAQEAAAGDQPRPHSRVDDSRGQGDPVQQLFDESRSPRSRRAVGARRSRRLLSLRDTARAMSQENVEIVRRFLVDAWTAAITTQPCREFDADCQMAQHRRVPGTRRSARGPAEIAAFWNATL